jgi:hypothetical protein
MIIFDFFRKLRNNFTGLNATTARFDILQSKLDAMADSIQSRMMSASGSEDAGVELEAVNATAAKFNILIGKLDAIAESLKTVNASVKNMEKISESQPSTEQLENVIAQLNNEDSKDVLLTHITIPTLSIRNVANSLDRIYGDLDARNKFSFLVHDPSMLVHYADVWKALGPSRFTIVLTKYFASDEKGNERLGLSDFLSRVRVEGYEVRQITEIINCGIKFEYVVTNHVISGSTKEIKPETPEDKFKKLINRGLLLKGQEPVWEFAVDIDTYLPLQIGNKQIRYMYGADISDGWSLSSWNNIYDIFLCHGVNDEREIKKRFKGKALVMGYPRYDRLFAEDIDLGDIKCEFGISESKKTVLWMPTLGGDYSSIPLFAEPLSTLSKKYNIIVRPHPLSFVQEKDFINLLEKFNFNIDRNALRDMNELFGVADVVLADNGGTPFSAIFLGRNVIFLDVPDDLGAESDSTRYFANSSVLELKKHLPVINHQDIRQLECILDSEEFYVENKNSIETLFKKYFDSPRGGGAKRVAEIFNGF